MARYGWDYGIDMGTWSGRGWRARGGRRYGRDLDIAGRESFYGTGYGGDSYTGRRGYYGGATDMDRGFNVPEQYAGPGGYRGQSFGRGFRGRGIRRTRYDLNW